MESQRFQRTHDKRWFGIKLPVMHNTPTPPSSSGVILRNAQKRERERERERALQKQVLQRGGVATGFCFEHSKIRWTNRKGILGEKHVEEEEEEKNCNERITNRENITIFPRFFNERRKRKTEGKRLTHNFQIISFVILSFDLKKIFPCFFQEERERESF